MEKQVNRKRVRDTAKTLKPDLVVITPPCGPGCAWQRMCLDLDNLDEVRKRQLPFWKLARYMVERDPLYRIVVFGLQDPVSHRYRKSMALDVNEQSFANNFVTFQCNHSPSQHDQIRGSVTVNGHPTTSSPPGCCRTGSSRLAHSARRYEMK